MLPSLLVLALTTHAEAGSAFLGVEWRPFSRQDLVFVEEGRTSGTAVGEFDGVVRPNLSVFGGGWFDRHVGLAGGFGVAAITSRSVAGDVVRQRHAAVLRPSLDLRIGWMEPRVRFPIPWVVVGVFGNIPTVGDASNGFTEEEQRAADDAAFDQRLRLGHVGGRAGIGVDFRVVPGLALGAQFTLGLTGSTYAGRDDTFTTLWVSTEAALLLTFEWPGGRRQTGDPPQDAAPADAPDAG